MAGLLTTSSVLTVLLLAAQLPPPPPGAIPAGEALRITTRWLQARDYYPVSDGCLEARDALYLNRGFTMNVVDRCAPDGGTRPLGRWRVDGFSRELSVQDSRGRFVVPAAPASAPLFREGYQTAAAIPLHGDVDGVDGTLELLLDARLTAAMRSAGGAALDAPDAAEFRPALRNARLVLVDGRSSRALQVKTFERPLASIETAALRGDGRHSFLLTVDYSATIGADNGPVTWVLEPRGGSWEFVDAQEEDAAAWERLVVASTGRAAWKFAPHGEARDILAVACLRDVGRASADPAWVTTFERYSFAGTRWVRYERVRPDSCWEGEDFPAEAEFPAVS
jgi:hypothetical protein